MFGFFRKKSPSDQARATPKPSLTPLEQAVQTGDYPTAIALLDAEVSVNPDPGKLFMALELRALAEDFDGALANLDSLMEMAPDCGLRAEFQPLLQNARVWHDRQTVPDYPMKRATLSASPPSYAFMLLIATQFHAKGQTEQAKNSLASAKEQMPKIGGTLYYVSGRRTPFANIYDSDDLTGPTLICSHSEGILDIPFEHIASVEFAPRQTYPDTLWNPARVITWAGEELQGRVFAYYVGTGRHESEYVRRLNMTAWNNEGGYAVAYGQRDLRFETGDGKMVGLVGINQISRLVFRRASSA